MDFLVILVILCWVAILIGPSLTKKFKKKAPENEVEYPCLSKINIHHMLCHTCKKPLLQDDLVIWSEKKSGWRSETSHAKCLVIIRKPDGSITRLDGTTLSTNRFGGVLVPLPLGSILVTEAEWLSWVDKYKD